LGQKCHESTAQQAFDHLLAVGKDEVGGSNPPSSSKALNPNGFGAFLLALELPRGCFDGSAGDREAIRSGEIWCGRADNSRGNRNFEAKSGN